MRKKLQSKIDIIKNKPHGERNRYARIAALITTSIIVVIWLLILALSKHDKNRNLIDTSLIKSFFQEVSDETSEIENTLNQQKEQFVEVRENFNEQKEIAESGTSSSELGSDKKVDMQSQKLDLKEEPINNTQ